MSQQVKPAPFIGAPIVDALAGLTGDKAAHCASVAGIVADALRNLSQHGNSGPVLKAVQYLHSLKGSSRGVLAVRDAFTAAVACLPFLTYSPDSAVITDTRATKRGDKVSADAQADEAREAFVIAYGTRFNAPTEKSGASAADKARKALALLADMPPAALAKLIADTDTLGNLQAAVAKAAGIVAVAQASERAKAEAANRAKLAPRRVAKPATVAPVAPVGDAAPVVTPEVEPLAA